MAKRLMWVEYGDDAELSRSQKSPGDYSPLTRDAEGNLGHVTLSDADEGEWGSVDDWMPGLDAETDDEQTWREEDVEALALPVSAVLVAARPHVERWWKERALPTLKATNKSVRRRLARFRKADKTATVTEAVASVDVASGEAHLTMSRDEAEQRLLAALVARAFSDEQIAGAVECPNRRPRGQVGIPEPPLWSSSRLSRFRPTSAPCSKRTRPSSTSSSVCAEASPSAGQGGFPEKWGNRIRSAQRATNGCNLSPLETVISGGDQLR
jgi:hypothetical protein